MEKESFSGKIINLYKIIQNETKDKRLNFLKDGYLKKERINFEYLNLDDIFERLIDSIPLIINLYKEKRYKHIQKEMFCVFIAALCEISKRGLSQGGLLKQIDKYIGDSFNRGRYYHLIKSAMKSEGIQVLRNKHRYLEETIVYESGIPKQLHRDLYNLFRIYWKWFRGVNTEERRDFLRGFIEKSDCCEEYIADINDYRKMCLLRDCMSDFKEKVIKTCIRIDKIYSEIDKIQEDINIANINEVCEKISEQLGYNILTVINEMTLKNDLINSAHCVSFRKFQDIISNLDPVEKIKLPTGTYAINQEYVLANFISGYHVVRSITYEVIFPYGLKCQDYVCLPRNEVIKRNDHYIYLSEDYFQVEIDGYEAGIRELVWESELLYVFAGKIPTASSAYIDGNLINNEKEVRMKVSVRKSWNRFDKQNKLAICLDEFKIFNPNFAMQPVVIRCNVSEMQIVRQINHRGHLRITEKWIDINNFNENIVIEAIINGGVIERKQITIDEIYIYSLQTGMRINDKLEWQQWHSDNRVVVFSRNPIKTSNIEMKLQNMFYNMYVYLGYFNFEDNIIKLNNNIILLEKTSKPLIKLSSEVIGTNGCLFVPAGKPIQFSAINCSKKDMFLKISHGESRYIGSSLSNLKNLNNFTLLDCGISCEKNYGKWFVSLYEGQEKVYEISFFVLSEVEAKLDKEIYEEGAKVLAKVNSFDECFVVDGEFTKECTLTIGIAKIEICENHVRAEDIEFEVIDVNCGFPYKLKLRPDVWGLKVQKKGEWVSNLGKKISLELTTKEDTSLIICSTKNQKVLFHSHEFELYKYIKSGFNRIIWRKLINNWEVVNDFVIFNSLKETISFQIIFNTIITLKSYKYDKNKLILCISIHGPIGSMIHVVAFANNIKICKIVRQSICNKFEINLDLDNISNYEGQKLVVEARQDDEDVNVIFEHTVKCSEKNLQDAFNNFDLLNENSNISLDKHILLSNYLNTIKLLNVKPCRVVEKISAISVLRYLGGKY